MGQLTKLKDKNGKGLYPITLSDAVVVSVSAGAAPTRTLTSAITKIDGSISAISGDVTTISGDVSSIKRNVSNIDSSISKIEQQISGVASDSSSHFHKVTINGIEKTLNVNATTDLGSYLTAVTAVSDTPAATQIIKSVTQSANGQITVLKSGYTIASNVPANAKFTDTTYESLAAAQDGVAVSLVTTGEKFAWNSKAAGDHTHNYAGASTPGGAATVALKLSNTEAIGSSVKPVYFSAAGVPVATSYNLAAACAKDVDTDTMTADSMNLPTAKAVAKYVDEMTASALKYQGTVSSTAALPGSPKKGYVYVVAEAGTYAGQACEVGDYIICRTGGASPVWDVVNGENQVSDGNPTLAWGEQSTVATVDGTAIHVTLPANPATNKADKATTLAGYGITDAKISAGTITLGTATITPLTAHQAIYGLTIQGNGTGIGTFDPKSAATTINITPASIGAAASGHNHDGAYLGINATAANSTLWNGYKISVGSTVGTDANTIYFVV